MASSPFTHMGRPEALSIGLALLLCGSLSAAEDAGLTLVCRPNNDLHRVLQENGLACERTASVREGIDHTPAGGALLVLADGYPKQTTELPAGFLDAVKIKRLRVYVEYPSALSELTFERPRGTLWERAVVSSDFFGEGLARLRILAIHDCTFLPTRATNAHIAVARVAGFDTAVYGLPKEAFPILFEHPQGDVLVATTKLSQFVSARYAPTAAWRTIWQGILRWLCPKGALPQLEWTPSVRPSYAKQQTLPNDVERRAVRRGVAWFKNGRLLVHPEWEVELEKRRKSFRDGVAPGPERDWPIGDGKHGILEGYSSVIYHDGTQPMRWYRRNDCTGESAMALAFGGEVFDNAEYRRIAANLNDFIYDDSVFAKGPRGNPESPTYGLLSWSDNPPADGIYYGDDNARSLLGTMACAALLDSTRWDEGLLRCVLANLRTSGRLGFRTGRLDERGLQAHGWRHYFNGRPVFFAPHYEAYLWACYLWAYRHTGYELLLQRAKSAISMTMKAYPDQWRWTNGIMQERARFLLPLAWLVRVEDTPEHRAWLRTMAKELLANQAPCGALREELGEAGKGAYGPPRSNEDYGKHEATLMQANGDPVCDLLYTTNFAFIGLHEAAAATGERLFTEASDKLANFLCRIQVRSEDHPELDGAWFRAFDFDRWEYWASNADAGWGAWSIESGWTQGWITAVLAMREMRTSLWDLTAQSQVKRLMPKLRPHMIPDDALVRAPKPMDHLARGKTVRLQTPYDLRYPGGGPLGLVDGILGRADHTDPAWHGFEGPDLHATIDLGGTSLVRSLRSTYLQSRGVGIFLPVEVVYAVSTDGKEFRTVATVGHDVSLEVAKPLTRAFETTLQRPTQARYVRVVAKSIGMIPQGHRAAGRKAWLFADEIVVR